MASLLKPHNGSLMLQANIPHFFKIILHRNILDGKLGIARKFVRKHGSILSCPVLLRVSNDAVWQVELTKSNGEIWLHKGWKEFVDYYSLAHGHLLVFEFHQRITCYFNVLIFDKSASEIDYPSSNINHHNENNPREEFQEPEIEETQKHTTFEILDGILPCKKANGKSPLPFPHPHNI